MKKFAAFLSAALILAGCAGVYAAAGTEADPLISLSWLNSHYIPEAVRQAEAQIDARTLTVYQSVLSGLTSAGAPDTPAADPAGLSDRRLKRGDVLTLPAGSTVMLLAGSASISYSSGGTVVDLTAGQALPAGAAAAAFHRLLAAENTTAAVTVTSDTAVLSTEGAYTLSPSGNVDYHALADALAELGLFRGTGAAYGSGYELESAPTRVVGLVMFLRLIGEEQAALACTEANPFADTPAWCERYVAYAYTKGYPKGVGAGSGGQLYFGPDAALSAGEYMTFLLRALGYSDSGAAADFSWSTALSFALERGVVNPAEYQSLTAGPFLRAQVAYLSLYALTAPTKDADTLASRLADRGVVDEAELYTTLNAVALERLGS